jgi:hypothetical protein
MCPLQLIVADLYFDTDCSSVYHQMTSEQTDPNILLQCVKYKNLEEIDLKFSGRRQTPSNMDTRVWLPVLKLGSRRRSATTHTNTSAVKT